MRQNGLRSPRFEEAAGSFRVTLYGDIEVQANLHQARQTATLPDLSKYQEMGLNPRQELALGFLARYRRITSGDYQALCPDVHPETLRRDLVELVSRWVLIKVGDKRATYYILK